MLLKFDVLHTFCKFKNDVENFLNSKIKIFHSDGGGEFKNNPFNQLFSSTEILHQFSCPHTPEQNGIAERKHHHIIEIGLSVMVHSALSTPYWFEAFNTSLLN